MKKTLRLVLISLVILVMIATSFNVVACPHFDEFGREYWLFYGHTRASIMFRYPNHFHQMSIAMDEDTFETDRTEIYSESFEFPVLGAPLWGEVENFQFDISRIEVTGQEFQLNIRFENTIAAARASRGADSEDFVYTIFVTNLLNDEDDVRLLNAQNRITANDFALAVPEIFLVSARFDYRYELMQYRVNIYEFYDPVEVRVFGATNTNNVVAINIDGDMETAEKIGVIYNHYIGAYAFYVSHPGTYILVHGDFDLGDLVNVPDLHAPNNPAETPNNPAETPNNPAETPNNPIEPPNNPTETPNTNPPQSESNTNPPQTNNPYNSNDPYTQRSFALVFIVIPVATVVIAGGVFGVIMSKKSRVG
ncbi:MAG: hypothetical protein FWB93_03685 [Oscillospiraceae bacterium]|nr:hypothetical protein [Oscillospiraceae bacterium]